MNAVGPFFIWGCRDIVPQFFERVTKMFQALYRREFEWELGSVISQNNHGSAGGGNSVPLLRQTQRHF
jgi:hypothetical protein